MSVRHIHTQTQSQAELERERAVQRAYYARRKKRMLNGTQTQAQMELDRQRAVQKIYYTRRKERILNDPVYREEELRRHKTERDQKRKEIENDSLHSDAR